MQSAKIWVPKSGKSIHSIADGSGIVSRSTSLEGMLKIYYEGNIYKASNLHDLRTRIVVAAGRLFDSYPTIAFTHCTASDMVEHYECVGVINDDYSLEITNQPLYDKWERAYKID